MLLAIPTDREAGWQHIVHACEVIGVKHCLFDIYSSTWLEQLLTCKPAGVIYRAEFRYAAWRDLFTERIRLIHQMGIPIYPRLHEIDLYESKRRMAYWLKINEVPHPRTWIFAKKEEVLKFIGFAAYPLIFKTDFGNASSGVRLVQDRRQALALCNKSFGHGYRVPTYSPGKLDIIRRFKAVVRAPYRKLMGIRHPPGDVELDVMLFQERVSILHEWRVVKSGESYFGNEKKPGVNGFNSGSGLSEWTIPSDRVFDFAREVCRKGNFATMCLDIFETPDGELLVNELQTIFGVIAKNQMYRESKEVGKVPFRKIFNIERKTWEEETGEFGQDYCYRLRVRDFISMLQLEHQNQLL